MKWEALVSGAGLRTSRASWPSSWAGHRRRAHAALQPTASAAHGPKLHSHGPLTSFRCRFVCGITSQKKSYLWGDAGAVVSTCMRDHVPEEVVPDVPSSLWIGRLGAAPVGRGGRCGEHLHAGQDHRGSLSAHQGGDRTRSRPNLACAAARARPRRRAASRTCGRLIKFNQV